MTQASWLVIVSLVYLIALFLIAHIGDQQKRQTSSLTYAMSIAVYCTSWSFFGTVGQAVKEPWSFLPIYLAPILLFLLAWRLVGRMTLIAKREHITSVADFIAARYGKSRELAIVVTLISTLAILPYLALQLRAVVMGIDLMVIEPQHLPPTNKAGIALLVTLALIAFTLLFGTRYVDATEHQRGMVTAIAFESVLKWLAFMAVAGAAIWYGFNQPSGHWQQSPVLTTAPQWFDIFAQTLVAVAALLCLPRQFHMTIVESPSLRALRQARWWVVLYMLTMMLAVLPLAVSGLTLVGGDNPDSYVIAAPLALDNAALAWLAYLGGTSAASGMVIVSTIALSIMITNEIITPLWLQYRRQRRPDFNEFSYWLLNVRRTVILVILLAGWAVYMLLEHIPALADLGWLSFTAIAQLAPALIIGLYWRSGNRVGVYTGLVFGMMVWLYLLWQMLTAPETLNDNSSGVTLSSELMLLSCAVNTLGYLFGSWLTNSSVSERLQAANFISRRRGESEDAIYRAKVTVAELEMLVARFAGKRRTKLVLRRYARQHGLQLTPQQQAPADLIAASERLLAGVVGTSSARLLLASALQGRSMQLEELAAIVDEASELMEFNRSMLQGAIEHIDQGISVVDSQLNLVAWNRRYLELFEYPPGFIRVGQSAEMLIRYNASRGYCGEGDIEEQVERRIDHMRRGTAHNSLRKRPDGRVIQSQGSPMPGGGFVMTFTDVTPFYETEDALRSSNEELEARVAERTKELSTLNQLLLIAKSQAERTAESKTRFLAAVGHDLMQPLNAAKLFASSLAEQAPDNNSRTMARYIDQSLQATESLIADLLEISRLESGTLSARKSQFALSDVFGALAHEFQALASQSGQQFELVQSALTVHSDKRLLRRILQNFLTNAFRYNPGGRVLLGIRRTQRQVRIEVWDDGPGIADDKLDEIFEEFKRLDNSRTTTEQGLGLGLAIAKGLAQVCGHRIDVRSWPGRGTVFAVTVPRATAAVMQNNAASEVSENDDLRGWKVLCIDNEISILSAMETLLTGWGCEVICAENFELADELLEGGWLPDIVLTDYHLADGRTGLQALQLIRLQYGSQIPGIVISADRRPELKSMVKKQRAGFINKPVSAERLRQQMHKQRDKLKG